MTTGKLMLQTAISILANEELDQILPGILAQLPPFLQDLASGLTFVYDQEERLDGSRPEAHQKGGTIYLTDKFLDLYRQEIPVGGILAHELGHYYKEKTGLRLQDIYSRQPPHNRLFGNIGIFGMPYIAEEEFAEAFATYFMDPSWLQEKFPEAYEAIAQLVH